MSLIPQNERLFSVRLLSVDSYLSTPLAGLDVCYSNFKKTKVRRIPVIRVFGSTPSGQTTCMHVHGVLPYLMVPYYGPPCSLSQSKEADQYLYQIALSIDQALNSAAGMSHSTQEHVFKIVLLRGKPFYGYYEKESLFMKIYFYLPYDIKKAADLLQAGAVMSRSFQPHEAHVPFILQFFLDYNLHGMNLLHSKSCWFRKPLGKPSSSPIPIIESTSQPLLTETSDVKTNPENNSVPGLPSVSQMKDFQWNKLRRRNQKFNNTFDNEASLDFNTVSTEPQKSSNNITTQKEDKWKNIISNRLSGSTSSDTTLNSSPLKTFWSAENIPTDAYLPSDFAKRLSTCDIEVDILAADILNRNELENNVGKNPGLEAIWEDERMRRKARNDNSQVEVKLSQDPRPLPYITDRESMFLTELNVALSDFYIDHNKTSDFNSTSICDDSVNIDTPKKPSSDLFSNTDEQHLSSYPPVPVVDDGIVSQVTLTPLSQRIRHNTQINSNDGNVESDSQFLRILEEMEHNEQSQMNSSSLNLQHSNGPLDQSDGENFSDNENAGFNLYLSPDKFSQENKKETLEMTQPWESGIEDLLFAANHHENNEFMSDYSDDNIPQLDGASDEIKQETTKNLSSPIIQHSSSNFNIVESVVDLSSKSSYQINKIKTLTPIKNEVNALQNFDLLPKVLKQKKSVYLKNLKATKATSLPPKLETSLSDKNFKYKGLRRQRSLPNQKSFNLKTSFYDKTNSNMFSTFQALLNEKPISWPPGGVLEQKQTSMPDNKTVIDLSLNKPSYEITQMKHDNLSKTVMSSSSKLRLSDNTGDEAVISFSGGNSGVAVACWKENKSDEIYGDNLRKSERNSLRPRSSRQVTKNRYTSDHFYETNNEDWTDLMFTETFSSIYNAGDQPFRPRKRKPVNKKKRGGISKIRERKPKKEKVFIKWIITHKFKGTRKMKIKLWRINNQPQVHLSNDLNELYSLYSPISKNTFENIKPDPPTPKLLPILKPEVQKIFKVPKGKRTKENVVTRFHPSQLSSDLVSIEYPSKVFDTNSSTKPTLLEKSIYADGLSGKTESISKDIQKTKPSVILEQRNIFENLTPVNKDDSVSLVNPQQTEITSQLYKTECSPTAELIKPFQSQKLFPCSHSGTIDSVDQKNSLPFLKKKVKKLPSLEKIAKTIETCEVKTKQTKPLKKSTILPVSNRTLTPVNQVVSTQAALKNPNTVLSESISKLGSKDQNIFQRISPLVASETAAMLQTEKNFNLETDPISRVPTFTLRDSNVFVSIRNTNVASQTKKVEVEPCLPNENINLHKSNVAEVLDPTRSKKDFAEDKKCKLDSFKNFDLNTQDELNTSFNKSPTKDLIKPDQEFILNTELKQSVSKKEKRNNPTLILSPILTTNTKSFSEIQSQLPEVISPTQPFVVSPATSMKPTKPTKRVLPKRYQPTKRVTRRSVTVRMKQLTTPQWMHDRSTDDSSDVSLLCNVLETMGYGSPVSSPTHKIPVTPPRPWSPMVANSPPVTALNNVKTANLPATTVEEDVVGVLDIDTESMLKEMGCIGDIMQAASAGMKQHGPQDDLLSHLDALLDGEDLAGGNEVETVQIGSAEDIPNIDNAIKEITQNSVGFMDILMDSEKNQKLVASKLGDITSNSTVVKIQPSNDSKPQTDINSQKFNLSAHPSTNNNLNAIKEVMSSQWQNLPQISDNSGVAMFSPTGLTPGLSNKQSLEIQLHKQMQAVRLQQQMLDSNSFRSTSFVSSKSGQKSSSKSKETVKSNTLSGGLQKDLLGEICQQVFSENFENSTTPSPISSSNSEKVSNTFSFGLNLTNTKSIDNSHSPRKLTQTPPFHVNSNAPNTFLYPCKTSPIHTEDHCVKTQSPIVTHPTPNPLQVLHTHVHHHHHIHSIKPSITASLTSQLANQTKASEKNDPKLGKVEPSIVTEWPKPKVELSIPTQPPLVIKPKEGSTQTFDYCFSETVINTNTEVVTDTEVVTENKPIDIPVVEKPTEAKLPEASILMKPTCQNGDERYWLQIQMQNGIPWKQPYTTKKTSKAVNVLSKKSSKKSKSKEKQSSSLQFSISSKESIEKGILVDKPIISTKKVTLKTPYFNRPKMLTQVGKRAPSNTPTISLSGGSTKTTSGSTFDLSQDMFQPNAFPTLPTTKTIKQESTTDDEMLGKSKKKTHNKKMERETLKKNTPTLNTELSPSLNSVPYRSPEKKNFLGQAVTAKETVIPLVQNNQELILNYVTGKWEIMEKKEKKIKTSKKKDKLNISSPQRVPSKTINIKNLNLPTIKTVISRQRSLSSNDSISLSLASNTTSGSNILLSDYDDSISTVSSGNNSQQEYTVSSVDSDLPKLKLTLKKNSQSSSEELTVSETKISKINLKKGKPMCFKAIMKRKSSTDKSGQKKLKKPKPKTLYVLDSYSGENVFISLTDFIQNYGKRMDLEMKSQQRCPLNKNFSFSEYIFSVKNYFRFGANIYGFQTKPNSNIISSLSAESAVSALSTDLFWYSPQSICKKDFDQNNNAKTRTTDQPTDGSEDFKKKTNKTSLSKRNVSSSSVSKKISHTEEKGDPPSKLQKTRHTPPWGVKQSNHPTSLVFKAIPGPPSQGDVKEFMITSNLIKQESKEPFYGDSKDVQSTSRLFLTLPSHVKKPRLPETTQQLEEFGSSLSNCSTIQHWRVVLAAEQAGSNSQETLPILDCANQIAKELNLKNQESFSNVMDIAMQLQDHPLLAKSLVDSKFEMVLKPSILPPNYNETKQWLKSKKSSTTKATKGNTFKTNKSDKNSETNKVVELKQEVLKTSQKNSQTPILKRIDALVKDSTVTLLHRPRKVSFDVSAIKPPPSPDAETTSNQQAPMAISPSTFPPNKVLHFSDQQPNNSSTMTFDSSEDFISMKFSASSPFSFDMSSDTKEKSKSPGTSSSAIASLIDEVENDKEDTSLISLLSGQFEEDKEDKIEDKTTPKHTSCFESTPVACKTKVPPLRKLLYTPIPSKTPEKIEDSFFDSVIPATPPTSDTPQIIKRKSKRVSRRLSKANLIKSFAESPLIIELSSMQDSPRFSGLTGPSMNNTFGFRALQQDLGDAKALHERQHVTIMSMELHVKTRLDLCPDPEMDEIRALFYAIETDSCDKIQTGSIIVDTKSSNEPEDLNTRYREMLFRSGITNLHVVYVENELELFQEFSDLVHHVDPDILLGYEVQMLSWGYLFSRSTHLSLDLCRAMSRFPSDKMNNRHTAERDAYGADNASEIHVVGRIVLNLWRLMRYELSIYNYKFESVAFHLLHERHPHYSFKTLSTWFDQPFNRNIMGNGDLLRHRCIDYYMCRAVGNIKLISQQDMIGRTSELARLFGIQFYEVLTRGSQFRVEGMMLRLAHSFNFIAVSPAVVQRAGQKAPECIALVMEPESRFFAEPVLVLDFQSLYPSIIIGHNYCFSTCLGRVQHLGKESTFTFGCTNIEVPQRLLHKLLKQNLITVAPNGVAYVKSSVRRGILPIMLEELLNTRVMVKSSIKKCDDSATKKLLDHRQLGLKLIANVTYGYTSANYSGRMPCVEIADSIVHKARETLERAINLVNNNKHKWKGRVVYGDTDSMFIALEKGTSKERAFEVGREIVKAVTDDNARPMKLKFEKVYSPCILQTKKRYVGYAYETEDQKEPIFDAKGIETVRRDGCPAVSKVLEKSLKLLFDSSDVSKVKTYVEKQCTKLLDGRSTLQDCTIAKEYRGARYYKPGAVVPALVLARKMLAIDRRSEPRLGERVPYVVVHGAPGMPLFQLVRHPQEVLNDPRLRLHGTYYVTKMVLPALDRMVALLGVDVFQWYRDLPRSQRLGVYYGIEEKSEEKLAVTSVDSKKLTISQYFESKHCLSCDQLSQQTICQNCVLNPIKLQATVTTLMQEARLLERRREHLNQICLSCTAASRSSDINCDSLDCPILYKRIRANHEATKSNFIRSAFRDRNVFMQELI